MEQTIAKLEAELKRVTIQRNDYQQESIKLKKEVVKLKRGTNIYITELDKRLSAQKGIKVEFQSIPEANHFFSKTEDVLIKNLDKYIKKETALY